MLFKRVQRFVVFSIACGFLTSFGMAQKFSDWSGPVNAGSAVNTGFFDGCPFVSKTGFSLYFASNRPGSFGASDIYVSRRAGVNDPWGPPQNLGSTINSTASEHCAFVTPDEDKLIFVSNRPGGLGAGDLYVASRSNKQDDFGWQAPQRLAALNSASDEFGPWGFQNQATGALTLYFNSNRPGGLGGYDIYTSTLGADGNFSPPVLVPQLSTTSNETFPSVRPDGLELFLVSDRPGGAGGLDIWTSTRASVSDPWSAPVNLGTAVNSPANDQRAAISSDGSRVIFFSNRPGSIGDFDLYEMTRLNLQARSGPFYFAQAGGGGGVSTAITLVNPSSRAVAGTISFFGSDGKPLGSVVSNPVVPFQIPPSGTFTVKTDSQAAATFGYACISSADPLMAFARYTIPGLPALVAEPSSNDFVFTVPLSRDLSKGVEVGIAAANVTNTTVRVVISVRDSSGRDVRFGTMSLVLGPGEQFSRSLLELFPALQQKITGTLVITALSPLPTQSLAVTVVQFGGGSVQTIPVQLTDEIVDPTGDFLPTYVGPRGGDLDVVSAQVTFTGTEFLFSATMDAPIGTTPQAFYVWGIDRGLGSQRANFAQLGLPDIVFDLVVVIRPAGPSLVNDLDAGIRTPLPPGSITINGRTILARVLLSMLPSKGFTPQNYMWNLWPRWEGIPMSDPQISDFAPNNRNAAVRTDKVVDPVGDFLPTYVGPRGGDLDVVSGQVIFTGTEFLFSATMDAPIGTTPQAFYVWGVDRGIGSRTSNFTQLGLPDIVFDLVVVARPAGPSLVNDLDAGIRTPLPPGSITINGKSILVRVPLSMLPSKGFTPQNYAWNLWPRWEGIPMSDPQISDFAPNNRNATVRNDEVVDPIGDFLPTYVGPRSGDLDVVSGQVTFTGSEFLFSATMDAPIGTTPQAFYVWGVDRGIGSRTSNFIQLGLPDIVFDLVVVARPAGPSLVNDLDAGIRTPLPPGSITIDGKSILVRVPLSMLPSKGFTPQDYMWNLWPRWEGIPMSDPQISDFAPNNRNAVVSGGP